MEWINEIINLLDGLRQLIPASIQSTSTNQTEIAGLNTFIPELSLNLVDWMPDELIVAAIPYCYNNNLLLI